VVAANSGRPGNPDWFHNLGADPSAVVELRGTTIPVHAEVVPAAEAAALWPDILRHAPTYERYRKYTGRKIPLVRLIAVPLASDKLTGAL
jgi:F420H(2)-dependent quinone reductase